MAGLVLVPSLAADVVLHRYFDPQGRPGADGTRPETAVRFRESEFVRWVQELPEGGATTVFLHFMPGVHEDVVLQVGGTWSRPHRGGVPVAGWSIGDLSLHIVGHGALPADTVLLFPANRVGGASPNAYSEAGLVNVGDLTPGAGAYTAFAEVRGGRRCQAAKVVVENLTLDCNWRSQSANGNPASPLSYKLYALHAIAARGRFRDLVVRDHGAMGLVCRSRFDNPAGMENFPVLIQAVDDGQEPTLDADQAPGDRLRQGRPWLVERCEVHGFNNLRGGYNTAIGLNVVTHDPRRPAEAPYVHHHPPLSVLADSNRRFAVVRNNQVLGGGYAFGQAGPGLCTGSTFAGNATVGATGGYNADTHAVVAADLTNNVFLDTRVAVRQVTTGFSQPVSINHHRIQGNLVRLKVRFPFRVHEDFRTHYGSESGIYTANRISDPSLVLGDRVRNMAACWILDGTSLGCRLEENFVTTLHQAPDPADASEDRFRFVYCPGPADVLAPRESGILVRPPSQDVLVGSNRVSRFADGFFQGRRLAGDGVVARFHAGAPECSELVAELEPPGPDPRSDSLGAVRHVGTTERLRMFFAKGRQTYEWRRPTGPGTDDFERVRIDLPDQSRLQAVGEVQIPDFRVDDSVSPAVLRGKVRLVRHLLPGFPEAWNGMGDPGPDVRTVPHLSSERIRIRISGIHSGLLTLRTRADGTCSFAFPIPAGAPAGVVRAEVYWNERQPEFGDDVLWEDARIAGVDMPGDPARYRYWCAVSSANAVHREAVGISVNPDVANDRNPGFLPQRPVVTLRRSVGSTLAEPLRVELSLPPVSRGRFRRNPVSGANELETVRVDAAYGTGSGSDYRLLLDGKPLSPLAGTDGTRLAVTIPAGKDSVAMVLVPTYDDLTEEEVVAIRVLPGPGHGAGVDSEVLVHVYDGPEFALKELTDSRAVNGIAVGRGISAAPDPVVVGNVFNYGPRGGVWTHPNFSTAFQEIQAADPSGYAHEALAVSDPVAGRYLVAGSRWSGSRRIPWAGVPGSPTVLPTLTGGLAGEAVSIVQGADSSALAVGWSERRIGSANVPRPVSWRRGASGAWTVEDLGSLQAADPAAEGQATALDGARSIGGWSRGMERIGKAPSTYGFHMTDGRSRMDPEKDARLPDGLMRLNETSAMAASAVYGIGRSVTAVGASFADLSNWTNAVIWRNGRIVSQRLFTPQGRVPEVVCSDALLLIPPEFPLPAWQERPLGRVWTNTVSSAVAVVWPAESVAPVPLTDPHLTVGAGNWRLTRPYGASPSGSIVGEGVLDGRTRGFVLVSRK